MLNHGYLLSIHECDLLRRSLRSGSAGSWLHVLQCRMQPQNAREDRHRLRHGHAAGVGVVQALAPCCPERTHLLAVLRDPSRVTRSENEPRPMTRQYGSDFLSESVEISIFFCKIQKVTVPAIICNFPQFRQNSVDLAAKNC